MPPLIEKCGRFLAKASANNPTLRFGIAGSLLLWLAVPPWEWYWIAWIAPVPWLTLIRSETLPGRRPYRSLWLAGIIFWLLAVHWIRLPHPLNYLAWGALAGYLGVYLPTFVLLSRVGVHHFKVPLVVVAPVVWTGLDWLRGHLFTGFLMASLAHTQYRVPTMIQLADIAGEYGVTFLMMFVAACIASLINYPRLSITHKIVHASLAVLALSFAVAYGTASLRVNLADKPSAGPRVALIQGNTPADWKTDAERQQTIMQEYLQLSLDAVRESRERDNREVDLVVWPETAFRQTLISAQKDFTPPLGRIHKSALTAAQNDLAELVRQVGCAVLVGLDRIEIVPSSVPDQMKYYSFNSAALVDRTGKLTATYDKMHRVPFGEYIPFADWFPVLYQLTPLTGGIVAGAGPAAMWLGESTAISTNICYETVVPHLLRHQLVELAENGERADVLLNLTNDAWFWGSSELDMHLACGVFRAVETRTPLLIAANGGLSAHVDHLGIIRQVTPRRETAFLLADLQHVDRALTLYTTYGDWFACLCVVCCLVLAWPAIANRQSQHP
jgi:apolipoprotein N-acyltransferase